MSAYQDSAQMDGLGEVALLHMYLMHLMKHALLLALVHAYESTFSHGSTSQASAASHLLILHWSNPGTQLSSVSIHCAHDEAKASDGQLILYGVERCQPPMDLKENE